MYGEIITSNTIFFFGIKSSKEIINKKEIKLSWNLKNSSIGENLNLCLLTKNQREL